MFDSRQQPDTGSTHCAHPARPGGWTGRLGRVLAWASLASQIRRERQSLDQLDDRMLRDIGIDDRQVRNEGNRRLWDIPASRRYQD